MSLRKLIQNFIILGCDISTEFECLETGKCIENKFRCDEDPDCSYDHPDSSDEKDCGKGDRTLSQITHRIN